MKPLGKSYRNVESGEVGIEKALTAIPSELSANTSPSKTNPSRLRQRRDHDCGSQTYDNYPATHTEDLAALTRADEQRNDRRRNGKTSAKEVRAPGECGYSRAPDVAAGSVRWH